MRKLLIGLFALFVLVLTSNSVFACNCGYENGQYKCIKTSTCTCGCQEGKPCTCKGCAECPDVATPKCNCKACKECNCGCQKGEPCTCKACKGCTCGCQTTTCDENCKCLCHKKFFKFFKKKCKKCNK